MNFKNILNNLFAYNPQEKYNFSLFENNLENQIPDISQGKEKIFPSLSVNIDFVKTKYNLLINSDIVLREFTLNARGKQYSSFLLYIDGMVDPQLMDQFVLNPLMLRNKNNLYDGSQSKVVSEAVANNITVRKIKKFDLSTYLLGCLIPQNSVKQISDFENVSNSINQR